jgi:hypothetical protein
MEAFPLRTRQRIIELQRQNRSKQLTERDYLGFFRGCGHVVALKRLPTSYLQRRRNTLDYRVWANVG